MGDIQIKSARSNKLGAFSGSIQASDQAEGITAEYSDSKEHLELLQRQKRGGFGRQQSRGWLRSGDDEDQPPAAARQRIIDNAFSAVGAPADFSIDFGHGILLTLQEKVELNRRLEQETSRIPRVPHFTPAGTGLLFAETFENSDAFKSWIVTNSRTHAGQWKHVMRVQDAIEGDRGIMAASKGLRHAISSFLPLKALPSSRHPLVIQYELQQQHLDFGCGGGHLTLFFSSNSTTLSQFDGDTPYALRFGADQCGNRREILLNATRMCPMTGDRVYHSLYPPLHLPYSSSTRLLTLVLKPTGTFKILVNGHTMREVSKITVGEAVPDCIRITSYSAQELPAEMLRFNAVGLAFMSMDTGTLVDNIVLSNDIAAAQAFTRETFWRRTKVEHALEESALRVRSSMRKEIRMKRREEELINLQISETAPHAYSHTFLGDTRVPAQSTNESAARPFEKITNSSQITSITPPVGLLDLLSIGEHQTTGNFSESCKIFKRVAKAVESMSSPLHILIAFILLVAL
ncbi:hypothetical protein Efla_002875 [Eimeria flavescens]